MMGGMGWRDAGPSPAGGGLMGDTASHLGPGNNPSQVDGIENGRAAPMNAMQRVSTTAPRWVGRGGPVCSAAGQRAPVCGLGGHRVIHGCALRPGMAAAQSGSQCRCPPMPSPCCPLLPPAAQEVAGRKVPLEVHDNVRHNKRGILSMARYDGAGWWCNARVGLAT